LVPELKFILSRVPDFNTYFEPFVGGGSVSYLTKTLFPMAPQSVSDANPWIMAAYGQQMKPRESYDIDEVVAKIDWYRKRTDDDLSLLTDRDKALRFAVCLLTAWGNRWETTSNGSFRSTINLKFCEKKYLNNALTRFFDTRWLHNDNVMTCDWKDSLIHAGSGDLVYIDPPYPDSLGYGNQIWDFSDQLDVVDWCLDAIKRDIYVMISNMATIERLYRRGGFQTVIISGPTATKTRAVRKEVIAWNWSVS
jgi:DNA adenine methylase